MRAKSSPDLAVRTIIWQILMVACSTIADRGYWKQMTWRNATIDMLEQSRRRIAMRTWSRQVRPVLRESRKR